MITDKFARPATYGGSPYPDLCVRQTLTFKVDQLSCAGLAETLMIADKFARLATYLSPHPDVYARQTLTLKFIIP